MIRKELTTELERFDATFSSPRLVGAAISFG
jgi:hypothetical protein